ncbi:MAG TPA: hypothetical protein VJG83_01775 [archaeon]|nr:hypothetical protein [archaeon]
MGIYDGSIDLGFNPSRNKIVLYLLVAIAAIAIIGAIVFLISDATKPSPLQFRFEKNPIKPAEMTKLYVNVTNISQVDLSNVPLVVESKENTEFDIYALNEGFDGTITNLSKGTSREIAYVINPVGTILPGTYVIVAKTKMNQIDYEKETILTVQE